MYVMDEPSNEQETPPEAPREAQRAADGSGTGSPEKSRAVQSLVLTLILAAIVFALIYTSFQNYQVEGTSMTPNVEDGQFIIVNKAAYRRFNFKPISDWLFFLDRDKDGYVEPFGEPQRGEVIVFKRGDANLIKRIIGLPGETIEVCGQGNGTSDLCKDTQPGAVFVDGVRLDEDYLPRLGNRGVQSTDIPPGNYYVFGDERVKSFDSRAWGMLPRGNIIGKAWFSYYPFGAAGIVTSHDSIP